MPLRLAPLQEWMLGGSLWSAVGLLSWAGRVGCTRGPRPPTSNPLPLGLSSPVRAGLESARV